MTRQLNLHSQGDDPLHFAVGASHQYAHPRRRSAGGTITYWIQILLVAVVFLSQFGIHVLTIGGRFIVEPAFALLLAITLTSRSANRSMTQVLRDSRFRVLLFVAVALTVVGFAYFNDFVGPYADFRVLVVLAFCYFLITLPTGNPQRKRQVLVHLAMVTMILDVIANRVYSGPNADKSQFNILACALVLYITSRESRPLLFLAAAALGATEAILSFYRTYWVAVGLSCVLFGIILIGRLISTRRLRSAFTLAVGLAVPSIIVATSGIVTNYFYSSESHFIQSIGKTTDFINAVSGNGGVRHGDDVRAGYFYFIAENPISLILPHGIGARDAQGHIDDYFFRFGDKEGDTQDSGIFYLAFHCGLVLSGFLVIGLWAEFRRRLFRAPIADKLYVFSGLIILFTFMLTDGDMFVVIERGAWFGAFLGVLRNDQMFPRLAKPARIASQRNFAFSR